MWEFANVQHEKRWIFARNFRLCFLHSATFLYACVLFLWKTEPFLTRREYETTRKNSNSSNLCAEGREIKFRAFLHQLYYIETQKCIRYCQRNTGMPWGASRCIFSSFKSGANFQFSIFQFAKLVDADTL